MKDEYKQYRDCQDTHFEGIDFVAGDVYLFHSSDPSCPADSSLWAVFDRYIGGRIYLESSTVDGRRFSVWHRLPIEYRYCRESTPGELKRYMSAFGGWEASRISEI